MLKKLLLASTLVFTSSLFAKEYTLNITGNLPHENLTINVDFEIDSEGEPSINQMIDINGRDALENVDSLKIVTSKGLLGTLKDEKNIIIYYKTSLNINGLKIRNLYRIGHTRVYGNESELNITFDPDHYQSIKSVLKYLNASNDVRKDIDNLYGYWNERR